VHSASLNLPGAPAARQLCDAARVAPSRILIENGYVLSMDETVGELEGGSVLIEGDRIAAVAPTIETSDAEVLDARGGVVMPGFVDTHRHTWQTALRAICADWTLMEYFRGVRLNISPEYTDEDVYAGNYIGALEALDAGVTTILDFSHCNNTPGHADSGIEGLDDAGIRAVYAYGYFPSPVPNPVFASHADRVADARRIRSEYFSSDDSLLTMGIAITETGLLPFEDTAEEVRSARELEALLTAHTACVWGSRSTMGITELDRHGLLDSNQVHVHCNALPDGELSLLAEAGAKVSSTPETELQMGMGHPVIGRALALGMKPTLGCDIVSLNAGDMFAQMRLGLQFERAMQNDPVIAGGEMPATLGLGVRDALRWATVNGAVALGLGARTGSLAPGKQADVIVIGAEGLNMTPRPEPVGSVVLQANASNVHTVLVAGSVVKRDGRLVGVDMGDVRRLAESSRERIFAAVLAKGPLLPPEQEGFTEGLNQVAEANLARAGA
jgi:cytosine/adenosine deaminase-related metal-dependent hydrolase